MHKLPKCSGQVFRGIRTNMMDTLSADKRGLKLAEAFPEGSELEWWAVTTTYTSASKLSEFAGTEARRKVR